MQRDIANLCKNNSLAKPTLCVEKADGRYSFNTL